MFSVRNEYDLLFGIWFFCLPPLHRPVAMSSLIHEQLNFIGIYENGVTTSLTNTWKNKLTNNKALNWTNDGQSDTLQCDDFSLNRFRNGATSTLPFFSFILLNHYSDFHALNLVHESTFNERNWIVCRFHQQFSSSLTDTIYICWWSKIDWLNLITRTLYDGRYFCILKAFTCNKI